MQTEKDSVYLPAVASGLALEPDEERVPGGDEVVLLHRFGEGVAEGLDDLGVVWPRGVVKGQGLAAIALDRLDGRFNPVYPETR